MGRSILLSVGLFLCSTYALGACSSSEPDLANGTAQDLTSGVMVTTTRNDNARTGANMGETVLTTANVKAGSFGRVFSRQVDGQIWAQPLYVGGVNGKNVVYVATEHNSVYAFDADDTRADAPPLWTQNFGASLPATDTGCGLLGPEIGITSTPVIDPAAQTIWFTTRTKENGAAVHKLHALDIVTGQPKANSPVTIAAQAKGTGTTSVNGVIKFDPLRNMQRPGLLKVGSHIYLGFASQCDIKPYHGWVLGYDASSLTQTLAHITTPNGGEGGIWNGGNGMAADDNGDVFYTAADVYDQTGQQNFNGAGNLGNSIVRFRDTGNNTVKIISKFTPFDTATFSPQDLSLGNGGGILIPGSNLFIAGDKRGQTFVVDRDNMGGQADHDAQIAQKWQGTATGTWGGGVFLKKGTGGTYFVWGVGDKLKGYAFDGQKFNTTPATNDASKTGYPGGALSISSNGETPGSAIVWGVRGKRTGSGLATSTGSATLVAFDGSDITKQLWSSDDNAGDLLGDGAKFNPPTIAAGKVFVGTATKQLVVYGLTKVPATPPPGGGGPVGTPAPDAGPGPAPNGNVTFTDIYGKFIGPNTPGHCGNSGCHATLKGGFKCGADKETCFQGLVTAGLVDPNNGTQSAIAQDDESPLAWIGGAMPLDNPDPNDEAAAAVKAWVAAGAKDN